MTTVEKCVSGTFKTHNAVLLLVVVMVVRVFLVVFEDTVLFFNGTGVVDSAVGGVCDDGKWGSIGSAVEEGAGAGVAAEQGAAADAGKG